MPIIGDKDLEGKWDMVIRPDKPTTGAQLDFQISITTAVAGKITGVKLKADGSAGPPLSGRYRQFEATEQFVMSLKLNIDGKDIFLSGIVIKPGNFARFTGDYNRLGTTGVTLNEAFEPGETGTGGGSQTT